jgi:DNA-binding transcriptional LysR family regulator
VRALTHATKELPEHQSDPAGTLKLTAPYDPAKVIPRIVANDLLFLRGVAASGGGIAMLPSFIAEPYVASGDLVRVLPSERVNVGGLVMLYSSTRPLARKIAAFCDFLAEVIEREWVG